MGRRMGRVMGRVVAMRTLTGRENGYVFGRSRRGSTSLERRLDFGFSVGDGDGVVGWNDAMRGAPPGSRILRGGK